MPAGFDPNFSFNEQLWYYYSTNRGKIRSRYNDLTRKFLAYNDGEENPHAFLRKPQFEALEMYVFVKEFMNNKQVYEMFDDWRHRRDHFSDASYYSIGKGGQIRLFDAPTEKQTDTLFKQMKKYREAYPNYIYALTMGLGKTILMATCIFYEFLLAKKYPKDKRFCHNALVFAPDKTVLQSLREIMTFDKTKVVPPEYARVLDANIKFHFLDETGTVLHTIDDSDFNIIISNTQKIIVKKKRKEETAAQTLFSGTSSLLSAVYGDGEGDEEDAWDDTTLMDNQRFKKLCRLPQLGVYVDEAHHLFGADLEKQIRSSGANKTSLRDTINLLAENTSIVACYNYTGTPYVKNQLLPEVVYAYGLRESIWNGFLKDADPLGYENVKSEEFLKAVVTTFWERYGSKTYEGLKPKLAIYAAGVEEAATEVRPALGRVTGDEILVKLDGSVMIDSVPVREDAAFRLKERRMGGFFIVGQQLQRLAGQRRGQLPVFPGALAVQLRQQQRGAGLRVRLQTFVLQEALFGFEFLPGQKALIPEHLFDALHPLVVRHGKQRVNRGAQQNGKLGQQLNIRQGHAVFPFGYGLGADPEPLGQLFLRHAFGKAEGLDLSAEIKGTHEENLRKKG